MADTIKIGSLDISAFKVGSDDCKVYLGGTLLYPQGEPPTPVFEGKYNLTLSDSSTVSAECDATSSVTSGEVSSQYSGTVVSAEIGSCVTSIGNNAFMGCSGLTSIDIPDSVTTIDASAFYNCSSLTSATIPDSVTSIGRYAFRNCTSLTSIDMSSGVTSIDQSAFQYCSSLTSVTIPDSVTSIGNSAFGNCSGLTSVTCLVTTPPSGGLYMFDGSTCPIYVPSGSVDVYKSKNSWRDYKDRIEAIPNS